MSKRAWVSRFTAESEAAARGLAYDDIWLVLAGRRTPFADYNTAAARRLADRPRYRRGGALFADSGSPPPRSTRSSPATWRSRASTPTTCRATSGCIRA